MNVLTRIEVQNVCLYGDEDEDDDEGSAAPGPLISTKCAQNLAAPLL